MKPGEKKDHHHISIVNEKKMDEGGATFIQRCVHSSIV
jgi:hypothetical protein